MMKIKKIKYYAKLLLLTTTITLTGCGTSNHEVLESDLNYEDLSYDDNYDTEHLGVVFSKGTPYICQMNSSIWDFKIAKKICMKEIETEKTIGYFDGYRMMNIIKDESYSDVEGDYLSEKQYIPMSWLVADDSLSGDTLKYYQTNKDKLTQFIDDNYRYKFDFNDWKVDEEKVSSYLHLYKIQDNYSNTIKYRIGYKARVVGRSDYIYDILEHKVIKIADSELVSYQFFSNLCDDSYAITASAAKKILEDYISKENIQSNIKESKEEEVDLQDELDNNSIPEKKYAMKDLYLIDTSLMNEESSQRYYISTLKKDTYTPSSCKDTSCIYAADNSVDRICIAKKYSSVTKSDTTFNFEEHYANYLNGESYLIGYMNNHQYEKIYVLQPGTIDHNSSNCSKMDQYLNMVSPLSESDFLNSKSLKKKYSISELEELEKSMNSKNKVLVK